MNYQKYNNDTEAQGNVLFVILLAVALFAALSFAMTQSKRGGGGNTSKEKSAISASTLVQYMSSLTAAVQRVVLVNGCMDEQLDFSDDLWVNSADYVNSSSPVDTSCHVFHPNGGGVSWQDPVAGLVSGVPSAIVTGVMTVDGVLGTTCDAQSSELVYITRVSREMCMSVNAKMGIINTGGNPPQFADGDIISGNPSNTATFGWRSQNGFASNYACSFHLGNGAPSASEVQGRHTGCYQTTDASKGYYFYHVLLPR